MDRAGPDAEPTERELAHLTRRVSFELGIVLRPHKQAAVAARLIRRGRLLGLDTLGAYLDHVESGAGLAERSRFIETVTTNMTSFFREPHHFELLAGLLADDVAGGEPLRLWSAGCANGSEAWSMGLTMLEALPAARAGAARILATDVDPAQVALVAEPRYPASQISQIPERLHRHLDSGGTDFRPGKALRRLVRARQLNLLDPYRFRGKFHVIFCRNTLMYFSPATKEEILGRLVRLLHVGGLLCLGHSEALMSVPTALEPCGPTAYRRCR